MEKEIHVSLPYSMDNLRDNPLRLRFLINLVFLTRGSFQVLLRFF